MGLAHSAAGRSFSAVITRPCAWSSQVFARASVSTSRTCRSRPSKSIVNPSGRNAPSRNQSSVCAACATCCAVVNIPGAGVNARVGLVEGRERPVEERLQVRERALQVLGGRQRRRRRNGLGRGRGLLRGDARALHALRGLLRGLLRGGLRVLLRARAGLRARGHGGPPPTSGAAPYPRLQPRGHLTNGTA